MLCLALLAAIFLVYGQTAGHDFLNYDDPDYVFDSHVRGGLSPSGIAWAFTSGYASNSFSLTWISHMLDFQLFGGHSGPPHLVNVALHAISTLLLFLFLRRITGTVWRSAFVAAASVGVELHAGKLNIAPTLRYTRWAEDHALPDGPKSAPNQVELVAEFSTASASDLHPLGNHLFAGILVGTGLTGGIRTFSESFGAQPPVLGTASPGGFIVGPVVGVILPLNFSVEINALYRPLGEGTTTWELPLLAKYKFPGNFLKPLIEAGPAFRLPATGAISNHGVTVGGGVELSARFLKIAPEIRYTRWATDGLTLPNQLELLVGFHF